MLFQGLAVFPHNVVQTQVQLVERQRLLRVGCCFPCGIIVCFLKQTTDFKISDFKYFQATDGRMLLVEPFQSAQVPKKSTKKAQRKRTCTFAA